MNVEHILNRFPEVTWDRFTGDLNVGVGIGIYGWLDDDFIYLRINEKWGCWLMATSSSKSKDFAERLGFKNHEECKRVADHFPTTRTLFSGLGDGTLTALDRLAEIRARKEQLIEVMKLIQEDEKAAMEAVQREYDETSKKMAAYSTELTVARRAAIAVREEMEAHKQTPEQS